MSKGLPEDIEEAIKLLDRFEESDDHEKRWPLFRDAIELLNEYLEDDPDSPHKKYVENLKSTFTGKMLEQFAKLPTMEAGDALLYIGVFQLVKTEIDKLLETRPDLYKAYHDFFDRWLDGTLECIEDLAEAKRLVLAEAKRREEARRVPKSKDEK